MSKPKKWTEVYPYGTKEGDEEARFFRALARHPKYDYRSTVALMKDAKLSRQRIEEIIDKYVNKISPQLIFPHLTNEDHWGYWERCENRLDDDKRDISKKDKDSRVDKHLSGTPSMVGNTAVAAPVAASFVPIGDRIVQCEEQDWRLTVAVQPSKADDEIDVIDAIDAMMRASGCW